MDKIVETTNISTCTCDCTITKDFQTAALCLVCGESVLVSNFGSHVVICDKCKKAILYMRDQLEDIKWK